MNAANMNVVEPEVCPNLPYLVDAREMWFDERGSIRAWTFIGPEESDALEAFKLDLRNRVCNPAGRSESVYSKWPAHKQETV